MQENQNNEFEKELTEEREEAVAEISSETNVASEEIRPATEAAPIQKPFAERVFTPMEKGGTYVPPQSSYYPPLQRGPEFNPVTEAKPPKSNNVGLKVFLGIVAAVMVICICFTGGYIAGKQMKLPEENESAPIGVTVKPSGGETLTATEVYEKVAKSVVGIVVYDEEGEKGYASGVVFGSEGYIITNDHIYDSVPNARFLIITNDGKEYDAEYVAGDTRSDIAVLKADTNELIPAEFCDSNQIVVGEDAMAIGYPAGAYQKAVFTIGTISATGVRVSGSRTSYSTKMIQTDSAINPGSSGGALVNAYGQVVGITSSKIAGDVYDSIGYAIPTNVAVNNANKLIEFGYVKGRAMLGVSYVENSVVDVKINPYTRAGLVVKAITEGGPLSNSGIRLEDIIVAVNDSPINRSETILDIIDTLSAGDKIMLEVFRPSTGNSYYITITLGEDKGSSSYVKD